MDYWIILVGIVLTIISKILAQLFQTFLDTTDLEIEYSFEAEIINNRNERTYRYTTNHRIRNGNQRSVRRVTGEIRRNRELLQ